MALHPTQQHVKRKTGLFRSQALGFCIKNHHFHQRRPLCFEVVECRSYFSSPQGTPADVLYKGTITRLITEDSSCRAEREREEALSKGHVVYEGISGHILTYDRECIR